MLKSTLTALCALAMVGTAMAGNVQDRRVSLHHDLSNLQPVELNGLTITPTAKSSALKAPARAQEITTIITEAPAGERVQTQNVSTGYRPFSSYILTYVNDTAPADSHVIYGDDGKVYIYNIMPFAAADTYVYGTIESDGKLHMPLPQSIYMEYDIALNVDILEFIPHEPGGDSGYWYAAGKDEVIFNVSEDGILTMELDEKEMLGTLYNVNEEWDANGMTELTISPFNETPLEGPTNIEPRSYGLRISESYGYPVDFYEDGETIYIKGLFEVLPDTWIKATRPADRPNTLEIYPGQYLGIYNDFYCYLMMGRRVGAEGFMWVYEMLPENEPYVFEFDEELNAYVSTMEAIPVPEYDESGCCRLILNNGKYNYDGLCEIEDGLFVRQNDFAGVPENCYPTAYTDFGYMAQLTLEVPTISTDDNVLDINCLSYILYIDYDPFEFDAEEYELDESIIEIPFTLRNSPSIFDRGLSWMGFANTRYISIYTEGYNYLSVQSVYTYNGNTTYSQLITADVESQKVYVDPEHDPNLPEDPDGVNEITAAKTVSTVTFFDLSGREVTNPENGIYLKRTTYSDGTTTTVKKAIR